MKTILVPVDLSPGSRDICDAACKLAKAGRSTRLVLLHVVTRSPVELHGVGFATDQIRRMEGELARRAARELLNLGRRATRRLGPRVRVVQRTGLPVPTILAVARALRADLLVLGSHGHTAAYDLLIGSTAQAVIRRARLPVLVVPMPA